MKWVIGIDIGGTTLSLAAVTEDGSSILGQQTHATRAERGPERILSELIDRVRETVELVHREDPHAKLLGIGAGAPGPLDTTTGVIHFAPNLGWLEFPLRDQLERGTGLPVVIDNDANCAVLGEHWLGAARGASHAVGITVGTGIGGGLVIDGKLHRGASDCAGEIGHTIVDIDGRLCGCGNYGCLEAYASGPAIAKRAVEQARAGAPSLLTGLCGGKLEQITAQTVYEAAASNDPLALEVVRSTATYLGAGLASLINLLNPEVIVVMGGVTRAGDSFFEPLRYEVARRAFKAAVRNCRILAGELGDLAGIQGAARIFLDSRQTG